MEKIIEPRPLHVVSGNVEAVAAVFPLCEKKITLVPGGVCTFQDIRVEKRRYARL